MDVRLCCPQRSLPLTQQARWPRRIYLIRAVASLAVAALAACAALPRLDAVPDSLTEQATVPGIPDARLWFDRDLAPFLRVAT